MGVYVGDLLIAGHRTLNDKMIEAVKNIWKTNQPEHLGPDPDSVPVLRLLLSSLDSNLHSMAQHPRAAHDDCGVDKRLARCSKLPVLAPDLRSNFQGLHSKMADLCRTL